MRILYAPKTTLLGFFSRKFERWQLAGIEVAREDLRGYMGTGIIGYERP